MRVSRESGKARRRVSTLWSLLLSGKYTNDPTREKKARHGETRTEKTTHTHRLLAA